MLKERKMNPVYIPRRSDIIYYYNTEFNNIWTSPVGEKRECFISVYGSLQAFKEMFELELKDNKEATGGLTALGFKILRDKIN